MDVLERAGSPGVMILMAVLLCAILVVLLGAQNFLSSRQILER
jgi:hypothetical protein